MMIFLFSLTIYMILGTSEQKVSSNYGSIGKERLCHVQTRIWRIYACAVHIVHLFCSSGMREKEVEKTLVNEVKKMGGIALKLTSPSSSGLPDRLLLFPKGKVIFVELKAPGKKTRKLQDVVISKLRSLGFRVEVVDTKEKAKEVVNDL